MTILLVLGVMTASIIPSLATSEKAKKTDKKCTEFHKKDGRKKVGTHKKK